MCLDRDNIVDVDEINDIKFEILILCNQCI